jgi:uncharacterized membrane protein
VWFKIVSLLCFVLAGAAGKKKVAMGTFYFLALLPTTHMHYSEAAAVAFFFFRMVMNLASHSFHTSQWVPAVIRFSCFFYLFWRKNRSRVLYLASQFFQGRLLVIL